MGYDFCSKRPLKNVLSFDIEESFHGEFVRKLPIKRQYHSNENVPKLLGLLNEFGVKATFFVVDEAVSDSTLVRIAADGHEIGFHTKDHVILPEKTPESFRAELREFKQRVARVAGQTCIGFRAPSFSMTDWAIDCLRKEDYLFDSSTFGVKTPLYDVKGPNALAPHLRQGLMEFPLTYYSFLGLRIPVAGGFYLRTIPMKLLTRMLKAKAKSVGLVLYVHNWEIFPVKNEYKLPRLASFYTNHNIRQVEQRLRTLLETFQFGSFAQVWTRKG